MSFLVLTKLEKEEYFLGGVKERRIFIALDQVAYIEEKDGYSALVLRDGSEILIKESIGDILNSLAGEER